MSPFRELPYLRSQLYDYLIDDDIPFVSFADDSKQLGMLQKMAAHQGSFIFGAKEFSKNQIIGHHNFIYNLGWQPQQEWTERALDELRQLKFRRAVFLFCIEQVPLQLIEELEKSGCTEFIYREANHWKRIDSSQSKMGLTFSLKRFRAIRRGLLRLFGKKLALNQLTEYSGKAHKVKLPKNVTQGSSATDLRSDLLLFEDDIRLDQSSTRIPEIIDYGKGRFCQRGSDLFFSTTDNSHPRLAKKEYRYVDLKRPFRRLNRFFYLLSEGLPEVGPLPSLEFESAVVDLIDQDYKLGLRAQSSNNYNDNLICLFSSSLGPGGTERQVAYFAKHLSMAGKEVSIFTCQPISETSLHYYPILPPESSIKVQPSNEPNIHFKEEILFAGQWGQKTLSLFQAMPEYLAEEVWNLYTHLMVVKPKTLHCWLDYPNILGAMAGWLAGVPEIILSVRNLNPSHFPHFYCFWYRRWYQIFLRLPNIKLIGNSIAGINDYSDWLEIPSANFNLVRNGIDHTVIRRSTTEEIQSFRKSLDIEEKAPLIAGIFRLDPEKRPFTFLEVVMKLKAKLPNLKVVMAGIGTLEAAVRKEVTQLKADGWINILGRRQDVPLIISASDIVLLTSSVEGTPNVLMEAQGLGTPVVCTDVGGVAEVVEHGKTGYVCAKDNIDGLIDACYSLLNDAELRQSLGNAGRENIEKNFSVEKMVENTLAFYNDSLPVEDFHPADTVHDLSATLQLSPSHY